MDSLVPIFLVLTDPIVPTLIMGTSIWVFFDARSIGVQKGQVNGFFNMGPVGWAFSCLLLWVLAFPVYLTKRAKYKLINGGTHGSSPLDEHPTPSAQREIRIGKLSFPCPSCNTRYSIDEDRIPAHGANLTCKVCGHVFSITRRRKTPAMKLTSLVTILPILLLYSGYCAGQDDSFRCNHKLVRVGDDKPYVLNSCGDPNSKTDAGGRRTEVWIYNLGERDFIYSLRFESERIASIERKGRGYRIDTAHPQKGVELKIESWVVESRNVYHWVKGVVRNVGGATAERVRVRVTASDDKNNSINMEESFTDPRTLPPGKDAYFDIAIKRDAKIKTFTPEVRHGD